MLKKTLIISIILILLLAGAGGFYAYKTGFFKKELTELKSENLFSFEVKDNNLPPEVAKIYKERYEATKKNLQENPDSFNDWLILGLLKKSVNDYEGSRDVYLYAGQIRPANSSSFASLADLYANFLNEPLKAETAIKAAIENDPNDYNFYITMAELYRYKIPGKETLYEQTLLDALNKFPEEPNVVSQLATYYRLTSQVKKAIAQYEKLVKLAPDNKTAKQDLEELKGMSND